MTSIMAVDVGGTFTDLVMVDEATGAMRVVKCLSTPPNFEEGVLRAADEATMGLSEQEAGLVTFVHGSTIVINHLIEKKGVKTALVTTEGFRDVLDIARTNRPDLYNLRYRKPRPYIPRSQRYEVSERISATGEIVTALDMEQLSAVVSELKRGEYEAVAIAFLNSYRNPVHEETCAQILRQAMPGVYVAISSTVKLWREYERATTAGMCAYVGPVVNAYLDKLELGLRERGVASASARKSVMRSNGGRSTFGTAKGWPIDLVESGPAAGVTGVATLATACGLDNVIALDVGGTTAKAALVEGGQPLRKEEYYLLPDKQMGSYPLLVPSLDIIEIGAGGGSIVRLTDDGAIRLGPDSVGANPGPACYGRGGTAPSITDALLLAGRLPETLASGLKLDVAAARTAYSPLANRLAISMDEVVIGVLRLAASRMGRVVHLSTVARGKDPRKYTLVAYGGSAPLSAVEVARDLGIPQVLIPRHAGVFAAVGMTSASFQADAVRTVKFAWPQDEALLQKTCQELEQEARVRLTAEERQTKRVMYYLETQYRGQSRSLSVPLSSFGELSRLAETFANLHQTHYGFVLPYEVEITGIHVMAEDVTVPLPPINRNWEDAEVQAPAVLDATQVLTPAGWTCAKRYKRGDLVSGQRLEGPALILESTTTTYLPPGSAITVDGFGNLCIETGV